MWLWCSGGWGFCRDGKDGREREREGGGGGEGKNVVPLPSCFVGSTIVDRLFSENYSRFDGSERVQKL